MPPAPRALCPPAAQPLPGLLVPGLLLLPGAALALQGSNQDAFLSLHQAARLLPDGLWAWLSTVGSSAGMFALLAPLLLLRPHWALAVLCAVPAALLFTYALKFGLGLPRPAAVLDAGSLRVIGPVLTANAFPSGHAVTAFVPAAIVGLGCLAEGRRLTMLAVLLGAALIAFSRIAVGAHWPLDVLAGAAGGWACGLLGLRLAQRWHGLPAIRLQRRLAPVFGLGALLLLLPQPADAAPLGRHILAAWGFCAAVLAFARSGQARGQHP